MLNIEWNRGGLDLYRLKFSLLTLIPKEHGDASVQKFRAFPLTNRSFKIFSQSATNRLGGFIRILFLLIKPPSLEGGLFLKVWSLLMKSFM